MKKKKKVRKCVAVAALSLEASTAICWRNVLESWERKYKDKEAQNDGGLVRNPPEGCLEILNCLRAGELSKTTF